MSDISPQIPRAFVTELDLEPVRQLRGWHDGIEPWLILRDGRAILTFADKG